MIDREPMLYIAQVGGKSGPVKIGWSRLVPARVKNLEYNSAFSVELLRVIVGGVLLERAFHRRFKHTRIGGEWFWFSADMLSFVPTTDELKECERPLRDINRDGMKKRILEMAETAAPGSGLEPWSLPIRVQSGFRG